MGANIGKIGANRDKLEMSKPNVSQSFLNDLSDLESSNLHLAYLHSFCTHFVPNLHLFCAHFAPILHLFAPNFAPFWPYIALIWQSFAPFCIYLAHICHQLAPILPPICTYFAPILSLFASMIRKHVYLIVQRSYSLFLLSNNYNQSLVNTCCFHLSSCRSEYLSIPISRNKSKSANSQTI